MTETVWPSAQQIQNANGQVIKNPDGTISVYTFNQATGTIAPQTLVKSWCDSLGIPGAFFDTTTQKCRWSGVDCENPFNIVLNPRGNDGTVFSVYPDETCTLSVDFDYLFKFDCGTLTDLANGIVTGTCSTIIDVFESLGASVVIDVAPSQTNLTRVYEETLFEPVGAGNLYTYISGTGINTGFFICGELVENTVDTTCYPLNLYNLDVTGDTLDCAIAANQLIRQMYDESGLDVIEVTAFTQNINANAFGPNWLHFTTEITDPTVISAMTNEKIKLSIKISGTCVDTCVLIDNIVMNQNCTKVSRTDIFLTQSPGFDLDRIRDNKKSWISNDTTAHRTFNVVKPDNTNPIRYTDYFLDNSQQVINTKEIDLDLNIAEAVETDVWNYISNNSCILTGVSIGVTNCIKDAFLGFSTATAVTSTTITGLCCPVTAITSSTVVTSGISTTFSCPVGYSATPANDSCQQINSTAATFNGSGTTIAAGNTNPAYTNYGAYFYPAIQNDLALPVFYIGNANDLRDQTGGTITALNINNTPPFWGNPGLSFTASRLNNVGLAATLNEYVGFSKCINIPVAGTYYVGIGADNNARFYINGILTADLNGSQFDNFKKWSVFPFNFNSGLNIIEMYGENTAGSTAFGAEIYNPTSYATLTGATTTGITGANVIFSTADFVGQTWELGTTQGFSCPAGYALNGCSGSFICTQILNTAISAHTAVTSSTVVHSGVCTDISCVTYTVTSTTVYGTTTITGDTICGPKLYCCSDFCGDANIDINGMMTQPLSGVNTIEDFEYFITTELVDAKDRKTITSYPTLRLLYDRYLNSRNFCSTNSAEFDYFNMNKFANMVGYYWVDIIEQVIPATTIWGSTKVYTNTIFDNQKFKYKSYSTLFGFNGTFPVVSSPATGVTCGVSATTTVIEGVSTNTASFFTQGERHNYNNIYAIQMNSGSEFVGTVSVVGPNAPDSPISITECSIEVIIDVVQPGFQQANGTATANVYGSSGPVTFLWNTSATTQTITGLVAEVYSVTVTDTSKPNCTAFEEIILTDAPCGLILGISGTNESNGAHNGTATVTPSNGVAPYFVQWSTIPIQTGFTATGLTAGSYEATVTDSAFCQANTSINITNNACALSLPLNITNDSNSGGTGSITVTPTGGIAPYTYLWSNSATTQTISGLFAGTYSVTVTDNVGCSGTTSGTVQNVSCTLTASTSTTTPASGGTFNGTATAHPSAGTPPYTYSWNTLPPQTTQTATGLSAGTYSTLISDSAGCSITIPATVSHVACALSLAFSGTVEHNGTGDGTLTALPSNGVPPYAYVWNTAAVTQTITGLHGGTANTYSVTVTDAMNCTISGSAQITNVPCQFNISFLQDATTPFGPTTLTAFPAGGTSVPPFTYLWNTSDTTQTINMPTTGVYTVTVTDSNGCIETSATTQLYSFIVNFRAQQIVTPPIAEVLFRINGGAWTNFSPQFTTISTAYTTVNAFSTVQTGDFVEFAVKNASGQNVRFTEGFNGAFLGTFCGDSSPYGITAVASRQFFFNVSTVGSPAVLLLC